ncbi:hypothetical protein NGR_c16050 [Sinorhizobium fredii NGR234]|uniref:Uncharacterized protein n=1 Tax=Sinorhizobium fredii (strain NBRC 101917 / NGR234) TaxID=394 RepID=C3MD52_SINFN|nr:hypothetical protein NGR_c16050 [Sinorhizobium fredii NGR234]
MAEKIGGLIRQRPSQVLDRRTVFSAPAARLVPCLGEFAQFFLQLQNVPIRITHDGVFDRVGSRCLLESVVQIVQHGFPLFVFLFCSSSARMSTVFSGKAALASSGFFWAQRFPT